MERTAYFKDEEIARAHQLRERATTATELRKALSVLLIAEAGLDAGKTSDILGISERTVFRNRGNVRNQDGVPRNTWGGRWANAGGGVRGPAGCGLLWWPLWCVTCVGSEQIREPMSWIHQRRLAGR